MIATMATTPNVHPLGCMCGFPFFAPNLPERQAEMRSRMMSQHKEDEKQRRQKRINQLSGDPAWHAVLILFTGRMFNGDGRVWKHIDLDNGRIYFHRILKDYTFSGGQRRMVEIAASLFNHNHSVNLHQVLSGLDYGNTELVLRAFQAFMGALR
jgi:hypothetical protein